MPTYKAEFLSHYYKGKLRPRSAYSMGLIYWMARAASLAPSVVNWITHAPLFSTIAKRLAGIHPERTIPVFARSTFKQQFHARKRRRSVNPTRTDKRDVLLWADTFNNHFHPETAMAAVRVLEAAGFRVTVRRKAMCCARPLFDWGMLGKAKSLLLDILAELKDEIASGTPVVVLEPSCASVFRDELCKLFPNRSDAQTLAKGTYLLSEFLQKFAGGYLEELSHMPSALPKQAVLHLHCHHAVLGKSSEARVLESCGIAADQLDAGCCGMAGAFGFEKEHYDISLKIGERKLFPAVRNAGDSIIIANGFSCRKQIEESTERKTMHLAEVLASRITA